MAELRARQANNPWEVTQGGQQQQIYAGQSLSACQEYVEKNHGNGDMNLGPYAAQVCIIICTIRDDMPRKNYY